MRSHALRHLEARVLFEDQQRDKRCKRTWKQESIDNNHNFCQVGVAKKLKKRQSHPRHVVRIMQLGASICLGSQNEHLVLAPKPCQDTKRQHCHPLWHPRFRSRMLLSMRNQRMSEPLCFMQTACSQTNLSSMDLLEVDCPTRSSPTCLAMVATCLGS